MIEKTGLEKLERLYFDSIKWLRDAETVIESEYRQGKKDGLRIALMLLSPDKQQKESYRLGQETSKHGLTYTYEETILDLLKDAWRLNDNNMDCGFDDISKRETQEWLDRVKFLFVDGQLPEDFHED